MLKRKADVEPDASPAQNRRSARNKPNAPQAKSEDINLLPLKAKPARARLQKAASEDAVRLNDDTPAVKAADNDFSANSQGSPRYWLMKAEPETRIEKGQDIKFSIDDLAAKTEPEPWDGIRNYAARNNLRAMKRGDLAFFYHSSCKVPAIVGIMEIVQEHSPDLTAQDPKKPYYDPKDSDPDSPRWSVVHVNFRRKFKHPVTLHDLKDLLKENKVLANMDLLGKGRLSVGKVSKDEWDFIMNLVQKREKEDEK